MSLFNARSAPDENVFDNPVVTRRATPKNGNHGHAVAKVNEYAVARALLERAAPPAHEIVTDEVHTLQTRINKRDKENDALQKRVAELEKELKESRAREANVEIVGLPKATYDPSEGVDRCIECAWEVLEGFCENCQKEHEVNEDGDEEPKDSLLTDVTYDPDREQAPRCTTPLLTIPRVIRPLPGYSYDQCNALLQRGATRLMIETFKLEFSHEKGIFAWADSMLYKEFAGPKMLNGDFWKIQLGRRFDLDEDDLDGSSFIEGILEDVVMFPGKKLGDGAQWETVEESPGIWVTQMAKTASDNEEDSEESEDEEGGEEQGSGEEGDGQKDDEKQGDGADGENDEDMDEDEDELKDEPVSVDDGPVRTCPGYDTSDDHISEIEEAVMEVDGESSDNVDMVDDFSAAIQSNVPDDLYDPDDTDEETEDAPQWQLAVDVNEDQVQVNSETHADDTELNMLQYEDPDSADSDFDDDETLSGDEEVLQFVSSLSSPESVSILNFHLLGNLVELGGCKASDCYP
ncbi:hypothetical protein C0995_016256 [Termitomyces sp. Mi166|nr:hypothetical protein C0995_016256 [Termitomyces sp. Mi166\